ncbi:MAG: hypothetical protein HNEKOMLI_00399 [Sodalis sp. Psp]|nr:hypothetical protein [Sodalis sp. Psp]MCR3756883.1 hypothetical protein [Sodalis sp. Ppy]
MYQLSYMVSSLTLNISANPLGWLEQVVLDLLSCAAATKNDYNKRVGGRAVPEVHTALSNYTCRKGVAYKKVDF